MNLLYAAAAFLVGGGASLALALLWLRVGVRRRRRVLDDLLALRGRFEADPLLALEQADHWVRTAGLRGLAWRGEWYGVQVAGSAGQPPSTETRPADRLARTFDPPDVHLEVQVNLSGTRGERRLFAEQAAQWLFVVLEGALAARELALRASMAQRARVAVFVQHDMRNLAQWIDLAAEDLAEARTPDELQAAAGRLRDSARAARERAQRIATAMSRGAEAASATQALDLRAEIELAASLHQVSLRLPATTPPAVTWDREALQVVLDNVLGNISRLSRERRQPVAAEVDWQVEGDHLVLGLASPDLRLELPLARVFEPWAGTRPQGWGVGLYQARKVALAAGADLRAESCGEGLRVMLSMPCKNSSLP